MRPDLPKEMPFAMQKKLWGAPNPAGRPVVWKWGVNMEKSRHVGELVN